jgi:hypothetical protein
MKKVALGTKKIAAARPLLRTTYLGVVWPKRANFWGLERQASPLPLTMHSHATQVILSLSLSLSYSPPLSGALSSVALSVGLRTGWLTWVVVTVIYYYYYCVQGNSVPVLFYT